MTVSPKMKNLRKYYDWTKILNQKQPLYEADKTAVFDNNIGVVCFFGMSDKMFQYYAEPFNK